MNHSHLVKQNLKDFNEQPQKNICENNKIDTLDTQIDHLWEQNFLDIFRRIRYTQTIMKQTQNTVKSIALLITTLSAFLTPFMVAAINIALPVISKEFAMDTRMLGWVATAYLLAAAMFLLPFGKLADIYGQKKIFTYGIVVTILSALCCAIAPSARWFIGFRVAQGIGAAMIAGTSIAILTSVFPAAERGKALGINVAATYFGLSLGPVLGGVLTQHFGWRSVFLVNVIAGVIVLGGVFWKLPGEWAEAQGERFDWIGALISGAMLMDIMVGFARLPKLIGFWLILGGIGALAAFVLWETRIAHPLLDMQLVRASPAFAFSNLAALIHYSATFAISLLLSLYLQYLKGLSPQQAGLVLVAQPAMQAVFSPYAGKLSDRIESRTLASIGMGCTVVGLLLLSLLTAKTSLTFIILALMLLGFGFGVFSSPNMNAVMSAVDKRFYGVASSTLATMRLIGQTFSVGISMLIFTLYIGQVKITPEHYPAFLTSVKIIFVIFAALCFGGIFASLARGTIHKDTR